VDEHDRRENELSLIQGFRLLSAYTLSSKAWPHRRPKLPPEKERVTLLGSCSSQVFQPIESFRFTFAIRAVYRSPMVAKFLCEFSYRRQSISRSDGKSTLGI